MSFLLKSPVHFKAQVIFCPKLKPIVIYCPLKFSRLNVIHSHLLALSLYFKGFQAVFLSSGQSSTIMKNIHYVFSFSLYPHAHKADVLMKCIPHRASVNIAQLQICLEGSQLDPLGSPVSFHLLGSTTKSMQTWN